MDGHAAIERNRAALKRIVADLVDMAGLADATPHPEVRAEGEPRRTLPRLLWRAILQMLRPAEAAARRLIIAAARGMVVPPPRPRKVEPQTMQPPPRKIGRAVSPAYLSAARKSMAKAGAETSTGPRSLCLPLFDPPRRLLLKGGRPRSTPPHAAPRVMFPGFSEPHRLPPPPSPDDPINAARLGQRIAALAAALDDLPGQAKRFARWKARRDAGLENRTWPIRRGRPPGGRLTRWDPDAHAAGTLARKSPRNIREIDEILAHAHSLALYALEYPDTS